VRKTVLITIAIGVFSAQPVSAQIAGENLPDMKDLRSIFGSVSSGEITVEPVVGSNGLVGSGIPVPDTGAIGRMAGAIARQMGEALGDPKVADTLEDGFVLVVNETEAALPQLGFERRDYGVAFALFFIMNWELANAVELPEDASLIAATKLVQLVQTAYAGDTGLSDAELDRHYDMFFTVPLTIMVMIKSFETEGRMEEADEMRELAGQSFEQVVGRSPYDIDITDSGEIKGY